MVTGTRRKWLTVEPLVAALTSWARRIIAGDDDAADVDVDVETTPLEEDEVIIVGPIEGR